MQVLIYRMVFSGGASYVGATRNFPVRRREHLKALRSGHGVNNKVRDAFGRFGAPELRPVCSLIWGEAHILEALVIESLGATLNVTLPTRLPTPEETCGKPFGPYPSVAEAARRMGVNYGHLKQLSRAYTYAEITKKEHLVTRPKRYIDIGGESLSLDDACAKYNVAKNTLNQRLHNGWSVTEAVGLEPRPLQKRLTAKKEAVREKVQSLLFSYQGTTAKLPAICAIHGIRAQSVRVQLSKGVPFQRAMEVAVDRKKARDAVQARWKAIAAQYADYEPDV